MRYLYLLIAFLVGCSEQEQHLFPDNDNQPKDVIRYKMNNAYYATEFKLSDGTRCVVASGIACEWKQ